MWMNRADRVFAALMLLTAGNCEGFTAYDLGAGSCTTTDMRGVASDMTVAAQPKCAAAKGLSGDNLLCVDFDKVTQLADPALAGWNFNANMANCWQISGGVLSVSNFATFVGNCGLTLPSIDLKQAAYQKYQTVTLALVHKVDVNDMNQLAQVFLNLDTPPRLINESTGIQGIPAQTVLTLTVAKADLPLTLNNVYQFFLKASSSSVSGRQGWQISSIAVMGSP